MSRKTDYDLLYRQRKKSYHKRLIHERELQFLAREIKVGKILDLGAGIGVEAVYLAKMAFDMTCVDISKFAMQRLSTFAKTHSLRINTVVADLEDCNSIAYLPAFAAIICLYTIPFLEKGRGLELINYMKKHTKNGGVNFITLFLQNRNVPDSSKHTLYSRGYLRSLYSHWHILQYSEIVRPEYSCGKEHSHLVALMMAKKR